ncbi:LuxR C-terminal-related transcriptional regulator [Saccharomonospora sp. NPDC046836]|uniref:ATP-binding protein n=1 Tax=Saccharomonospora sp. NPDC046836 TaxID=3156921 RepID=UPI0033F67B1C
MRGSQRRNPQRRSVGNLPAELTSFVGRRHELSEAKRILSTSRLLTLTGTGGLGKTRLALRLATDLRRAFPDGVWVVELADLRDPDLLPSTVATTLGLRAAADPTTALTEYLEGKDLLLVLDNCEHLVDASAVVIAKLLAATNGVRAIATSRHALRVPGEHILHLEPLTLPQDQDGQNSSFEAMALFAERAAAVVPGFEVTPENRDDVIAICRRLEGIPLAIELAAVRLRVLTVQQLLHRLEDRLGLLTSGRRTVLPRQRTLEATIGWSFDLCSPAEQQAGMQLSVFSGGFDLDAAEHVFANKDTDDGTVLDVVTGLVDKSVLNRQDGTFGRQAWYRMLEIVRDYVGAKLAGTGDEDAVRARQVRFYVELSRSYREDGFGPRQLDWFSRLRREHVNLRAVLEYCLSTPGHEIDALNIAASLWNFWYCGGFLAEGYRYLRRGLDATDGHTMVRARGLYWASYVGVHVGEFDAVRPMLAELQEIADHLDDDELRAGYAECCGTAAFHSGDLRAGAMYLEQALTGYRATGDALLVFDTLIVLAAVYFFLEDPRGADVAAEALALTERHDAQWSRAYALWAVAIHHWRAGRNTEATALLKDAVELRLPERSLQAFLLEALTWCATADGDYERAARLLGASDAVWRLSGILVREMSPYRTIAEDCAAAAREALGPEGFDTAYAEAATFGVDDAIDYALHGKRRGTSAAGPARRRYPGGLTRREWQIADLVAQGMTNTDIAATLVIGRRTVETHVEHILEKLGFNSRNQVGTWWAQH